MSKAVLLTVGAAVILILFLGAASVPQNQEVSPPDTEDVTGRFNAKPQRGPTPLTVTFTTNQRLTNSRFLADAGDYKIVFGDGAEYTLPCSGDTPQCDGPHTVMHTYKTDGTYTAQLVNFGYFAPPGSAPSTVVESKTIYVK